MAEEIGASRPDDQIPPDPLPPAQPAPGQSEPGQPLADEPDAPAFTDDRFVREDQDSPDPFTPEEISSPDQTPADELSGLGDQPSTDDQFSVDHQASNDDQPAPLDPRAPRFKDGMPLEVEMLQGSHPEHMAQFVSVAPGCYAVLLKGLGYARAGDGGLYAFDMRAYMDGIPPEPYSGIPLFGWGADLDVDAFLASIGEEEFADELGEISKDGGQAADGEDALAALTPDQREIAGALIDNVADPSAAILQARERIYSEGENIPGAEARPDLLQLAAHANRNERNISAVAMDMWITR